MPVKPLSASLASNIIASWKDHHMSITTTTPALSTCNTNTKRQQAAQRRAAELSSILLLRNAGKSLREIAAELTASRVPTANGGAWGPKQVRDILQRLTQQPTALPEHHDLAADLYLTDPTAVAADCDPLAAFLPETLLAS